MELTPRGDGVQLPILMRSLVLTLVLAYLGIALFLFLFQGRLLYLPHVPGRGIEATPDRYGLPWEEVWLETEDGERLHGWWIPATDATRTVLIFHGNAGNISHRMETLRIWHELGWNALIFDYRGYGRSSGRPTEKGTYRDADAAWRHLTEDRGLDPARIILFGRSLGGAVAAELAPRVNPAGLVVESTFTSLPELGAELYRWLPVRLLARMRYPTLERVSEFKGPVLVIHSRDDEIIPFHHGERIHAAAPGPRAFLELRGGHNEAFFLAGARYMEGLWEFLDEVTP